MKIKCEYCGNFILDSDESCPHCGAVNSHLVRGAEGIPKTIAELKDFCLSHNLPLDKMRFFIGENYKQPKAFGIYQDDNGDFVVYKNKANGQRAIRYQGKDEAYAVNELYQKMKAEVLQRKANLPPKQPDKNTSGATYNTVKYTNYGTKSKSKNHKLISQLISIGIVVFVILAFFLMLNKIPDTGYYNYNDQYYYYYQSDWYYYDSLNDDWYYTSNIDSELHDNYNSYDAGDYNDSFNIGNFQDSGYYTYESDSSWNDDSWDYNDSDWDSDW